jgi:hypothetical protein
MLSTLPDSPAMAPPLDCALLMLYEQFILLTVPCASSAPPVAAVLPKQPRIVVNKCTRINHKCTRMDIDQYRGQVGLCSRETENVHMAEHLELVPENTVLYRSTLLVADDAIAPPPASALFIL